MVLPHAPEDLVRDVPAKCSKGLPLGVAASPPALHVSVATAPETNLSDRDSVERRVELTVPPTVKAVPLLTSRPDRDGGASVVHGELSGGLESTDTSSLANQLGGTQCSAAL